MVTRPSVQKVLSCDPGRLLCAECSKRISLKAFVAISLDSVVEDVACKNV